MELDLDALSAQGWQTLRPGRFVQTLRRGEAPLWHRLDHCPHRPGSGDEIRYAAELERAGWTLAARKKGWRLWTRPAEEGERPALPGDRERITALFRARIARLESIRRWMLVLAALLMVGGYASGLRIVMTGAVLPLAVILWVTYRIKFMEEAR